MGAWSVDGTDVGFLVDCPCDRAIHLFLFVAVVVRTVANGSRFMSMGPQRHDTDEIERRHHEAKELREQLKNW